MFFLLVGVIDDIIASFILLLKTALLLGFVAILTLRCTEGLPWQFCNFTCEITN